MFGGFVFVVCELESIPCTLIKSPIRAVKEIEFHLGKSREFPDVVS